MRSMLETEQERMEAVWRQRAVRLSRRALGDRTARREFPVLVLEIDARRYGIELADVAEVLPPTLVTPVPGASPFFLGVVNVHGEIRPVADLKRLLGIESAVSDSLARVILLRKDRREMGLVVDRVEEIRSVASGDAQSAGNRYVELSTRYLKGLRHDTLMLLNTEELFKELIKDDTA